jgi:DDRGK domain-containing protein 1
MAQRLRNRRQAGGDEDEDELLNDPEHKLSKKEIIKLQKKQEKDRIREGMRQQKEEQEQRRAEQEAKIEEQDQKIRDEEERIKEEERKKKELEELKEKEEYDKWRDMFSVDAEGDKQEEDAQFENKLQLFIDFITVRKVVLFEDLAAEFNLSSKEVIDRIQRLQESGRLLGICDDRGKFIHITEQEYESVARYIKSRGRVNKGDLLLECNKLVRLQPKAEDTARIKQEQKKILEKVE